MQTQPLLVRDTVNPCTYSIGYKGWIVCMQEEIVNEQLPNSILNTGDQ